MSLCTDDCKNQQKKSAVHNFEEVEKTEANTLSVFGIGSSRRDCTCSGVVSSWIANGLCHVRPNTFVSA